MGKVKPLIFMLCSAVVILLLTVGFFSFGWFINNKSTTGDDTALKATDSDFELGAFDSSGAFDEYLTAENGTLLTNVKTEQLFSKISPTVTGGGKNEIKWLINDKSNFNNYSGENAELGIQPGSSGKLSFYVIAKRDMALNITFSLDTVLYTSDAKPISETNADNSDCVIASDSPEAGLVGGHILFFLNYDENSMLYSNRITDGSFVFSQPDAKAGTAYKADIYWVWPYVADQLILPENDSCFSAKEYGKLISDADSEVFKTELVNSPERFFADTSFDIAAAVGNVSKGTASPDFNMEYYNKLNARWNEADQLIGKSVGFIELQISNVLP